MGHPIPRALPWADISHPFGVKNWENPAREADVPPPQGGKTMGHPIPRALPWAEISHPYRVKNCEDPGQEKVNERSIWFSSAHYVD
jgi:hypothetical protein